MTLCRSQVAFPIEHGVYAGGDPERGEAEHKEECAEPHGVIA
jgi:hypothetical protein